MTLDEVLNLLAEEACEIAIAVSKIRRFGLEGDGRHSISPRDQLIQEIGDFDAIQEILRNMVEWDTEVMNAKQRKFAKLKELGII